MEAHTVCAGPVPESVEQSTKQSTKQQDTKAPPVLVAVSGGKSSGQRSMMGVVTDTPSVAIS